MNTLKNILTISLLSLMTISCKGSVPIDTIWEREFENAKEIIDTYNIVKEKTGKKEKELQTLNNCYYIWNCGEYMFKCRGKNEDISALPLHAEKLSFDDDIVMKFMDGHNAERFADHYFTLEAMHRGCSYEEARDGLTVTVFFPIRGLNSNDYNKLKTVFSCKNKVLHEAYLKKMVHPLNNNGCNKEFLEVRDIIIKNVADSDARKKILQMYDAYIPIMPGAPAPNVSFRDTEGNRHKISDFKGKVLVMDVWATWCGSCLKNMPHYIEFRERYKENGDVEFVTVSTDSDEIRDRWLAAIKKHKMTGMLNLMPDRNEGVQFEEEYKVSGVPRYIVIDKKGDIISAFAPKPGDELNKIIKEALED